MIHCRSSSSARFVAKPYFLTSDASVFSFFPTIHHDVVRTKNFGIFCSATRTRLVSAIVSDSSARLDFFQVHLFFSMCVCVCVRAWVYLWCTDSSSFEFASKSKRTNARPERQHSPLSLLYYRFHHITSVSFRARALDCSGVENSLVPHTRLFSFVLVMMMMMEHTMKKKKK